MNMILAGEDVDPLKMPDSFVAPLTARAEQFREYGFLDPLRILPSELAERLYGHLRRPGKEGPPDWEKSMAVVSRACYEIASHPGIADIVCELIGENVLLWGASIQSRRPGAVHPWHSDIETVPHIDRTVSVWLGLKDVCRDSSLIVVPRSHRFGPSIQELRRERGVVREDVDRELVEEWAREIDPDSRVVVPDVLPGMGLFFDGRLWHGSHNVTKRTRHALLLQFATSASGIRIPDFTTLDWPFRYLDHPRPSCIMIRGESSGSTNRIVPPPRVTSSETDIRLTNRAHRIDVPLASDETTGWRPYPLFDGTTPNHASLTCHVSSLAPGKIPHPPPRHPEEELLMMLAGEADLLLPDLTGEDSEKRVRVRPGQFVYYPADFHHSLEAVGAEPANYLMFKWHSTAGKDRRALAYGCFRATSPEEDVDVGFRAKLLFEGPTRCLRKLHSHRSTLTPGAGYAEHVDAHDVAIVVFEGEIETLGQRYGPNSVIYCPAGEPHGMHNPGESIARYVVFEFHGHTGALPALLNGDLARFVKKSTDPKRWRKKVKKLLRPIRQRL